MGFYEVARAQGFARRINDRMSRLVENLGYDSPVVEDLKEKLDRFFPDNIRFKDGVLQIMKPAQLATDEGLKALENVEKVTPTWGEIRKEYEEKYISWQEDLDLPEEASLRDYINVNMRLPSALENMYTILPGTYAQQALNIMKIKGRKKTYDELITAIRQIDKQSLGIIGTRFKYSKGIKNEI